MKDFGALGYLGILLR